MELETKESKINIKDVMNEIKSKIETDSKLTIIPEYLEDFSKEELFFHFTDIIKTMYISNYKITENNNSIIELCKQVNKDLMALINTDNYLTINTIINSINSLLIETISRYGEQNFVLVDVIKQIYEKSPDNCKENKEKISKLKSSNSPAF